MSTYKITAPDGKQYVVNAPDGASQDDVMAYVQANYQHPTVASGGTLQGAKQVAPKTPEPTGTTSVDENGNYDPNGKFRGVPKVESLPGVGGAISDFAIGATHHLANIPLGLGQLVGHGVGAVANLVAPDSDITGQINQTIKNSDAALAQREAEYQRIIPNSPSTYAGAGAGEIAPFLVSAPARALTSIGEGSAKILPQALQGGRLAKILSGAVQGGTVGAVQPVTTPTSDGQTLAGLVTGQAPAPSYAAQKAQQVGLGSATGGAIPAAAGIVGGVKGVIQHAMASQPIIDANIARLFGNDPAVLAKLQGAQQLVPGEVPTAAQAIASPEAVQAERMLRNNPSSAPAFVANDAANNQARTAVVNNVAGDDAQLQQAIQARRDATQPFRDANLPKQGSALVDPSAIMQTLDDLTTSGNNTIRGAAKTHLSLLQQIADKNGGKVPATALDDIRQGVGSTLASIPQNGAVTPKEVALYAPVSDQITDAIESAVPGYRNYLATYADKSGPINTMESGQKLAGSLDLAGRDATGNPRLTIAQLRSALKGDDKARYPMSDQARQQLDDVGQSLARRSISDNNIGAAGPGTAADLQAQGKLASLVFGSRMGAKGGAISRAVGGSLGAGLGSTFGPVGAAVGASVGGGLSALLGAANARVIGKVGATAANANETAAAIQRYMTANAPQRAAILQKYPQLRLLISAQPAQFTTQSRP